MRTIREKLGIPYVNKRGGRKATSGNGGPSRRIVQDDPPLPQLARRSVPFPPQAVDTVMPVQSGTSSDVVAGPSAIHPRPDEQSRDSPMDTKLPSPPPSERRGSSASPNVLRPPGGSVGATEPSESHPTVTHQRTFDPAVLRGSIRHIAERITASNEKRACTNDSLRLLIMDLKTRLVDLDELLSTNAAEQEDADESELAETVHEIMLEKEREIVAYVKQNSKSILKTDTRLYILIMDLSKRLELQ